MKTKAAVRWGQNEKWQVEQIDLDPPGEGEVRVKLAATGPDGYVPAANEALTQGWDLQAFQLLYAAALTHTEDEDLWGKRLRWCEGLNRPVMGISWGLAVEISGVGRRDGSGRGAGRGAGSITPMQLETWRQQFQEALGEEVASGCVQGLTRLYNNGLFGGRVKRATNDNVDMLGTPSLKGPIVLGVGDRTVLVDRAREFGLDIIMVGRISSTGRFDPESGEPVLSLQFRLIDAITGSSLWSSRNVSTADIAIAQQRKRPHPLMEVGEQVMNKIKEEFVVKPTIPELDSERVHKAADRLCYSDLPQPLPVLTALRYFEAMELISQSESLDYHKKLLGDTKGSIFASGGDKERADQVKEWIPEIPRGDEFDPLDPAYDPALAPP